MSINRNISVFSSCQQILIGKIQHLKHGTNHMILNVFTQKETEKHGPPLQTIPFYQNKDKHLEKDFLSSPFYSSEFKTVKNALIFPLFVA